MHSESVNELITLCKCPVVAAITEALRGCQHKSQVIIQRLLCSVAYQWNHTTASCLEALSWGRCFNWVSLNLQPVAISWVNIELEKATLCLFMGMPTHTHYKTLNILIISNFWLIFLLRTVIIFKMAQHHIAALRVEKRLSLSFFFCIICFCNLVQLYALKLIYFKLKIESFIFQCQAHLRSKY